METAELVASISEVENTATPEPDVVTEKVVSEESSEETSSTEETSSESETSDEEIKSDPHSVLFKQLAPPALKPVPHGQLEFNPKTGPPDDGIPLGGKNTGHHFLDFIAHFCFFFLLISFLFFVLLSFLPFRSVPVVFTI